DLPGIDIKEAMAPGRRDVRLAAPVTRPSLSPVVPARRLGPSSVWMSSGTWLRGSLSWTLLFHMIQRLLTRDQTRKVRLCNPGRVLVHVDFEMRKMDRGLSSGLSSRTLSPYPPLPKTKWPSLKSPQRTAKALTGSA